MFQLSCDGTTKPAASIERLHSIPMPYEISRKICASFLAPIPIRYMNYITDIPLPATGVPIEVGYRMTSQPMYFTSTSGSLTLPSACWQFSRMAATVRPTATPLPLRVWVSSALPPFSRRNRIWARRA